MSTPPLILASHSTGRAELLRAAGYAFAQWPSYVEEPERGTDESITDYVVRLALLKAQALGEREPNAIILAADTVLGLDGETIGKPRDAEHAVEMLARLGGRVHEVASGFAVLGPGTRPLTGADVAKVTLRRWTHQQIAGYVERYAPLRFAGAYALQGEGSVMVERLDGDPSTVIGMPLGQVMEALARFGIEPGH